MNRIILLTLILCLTHMGVIAQTKKSSSVSSTKYVYAMFTISKPVLFHSDAITIGDKYYPEKNEVNWKEVVFLSEIKEIRKYSEDEKYKFLDYASEGIKQTQSSLDQEFSLSVFTKIPFNKRDYYDSNKSKIIKRSCLVFNSYKEASVDRAKNIY
jgi:WD40 repeat protein